MPLINCEINFILTWSENCVLTNKATIAALPAQEENPAVAAINNPTNATFQITDAKLYAPVVTLSAENDKMIKEPLNGINKGQKWLIRLKITTSIV